MEMMKAAEIQLSGGSYRAIVAPFGASLRTLAREGYGDLIWGYSGLKSKRAGQGDVLMPFPSRIRDGRYVFDGKAYQLDCNDKEGHSAIHGFLRTREWEIARQESSCVSFTTRIGPEDHAGYPFTIRVTMAYELGEGGLRCEFSARNEGEVAAPFGAGFHPYLVVGPDPVAAWEAGIPADRIVELGAGFVPTGRILNVREAGVDFREPRAVGDVRLNHCFAGLQRDTDGIARAFLRDPRTGRTVTVWMDRTFQYLVAYTGDAIEAPFARRSLALEPMTCATDAFNRPELGMIRLEPGQAVEGIFGIL